MNHRREAGKFQTAGVNHHHPLQPQIQPYGTPTSTPSHSAHSTSKTVFIEKREVPRKKKFTRE